MERLSLFETGPGVWWAAVILNNVCRLLFKRCINTIAKEMYNLLMNYSSQ